MYVFRWRSKTLTKQGSLLPLFMLPHVSYKWNRAKLQINIFQNNKFVSKNRDILFHDYLITLDFLIRKSLESL